MTDSWSKGTQPPGHGDFPSQVVLINFYSIMITCTRTLEEPYVVRTGREMTHVKSNMTR